MGVVYEGRASDGTRVAIKTLMAAFALDGEVVGRFLAEARALKELSHKALVEIFSIGQLEDGTHYYVMEFLEGKTFEDVISHGAPLEPREVMSWMCEVLDALEVVHAHGVIHRDLKPSNLFLARTGVGPQVKLIDFGVAKHTGSSQRSSHKTAVSAIVGTPDYMSPEQVNGGAITAASDLYALGCVMYEMLTGQLPFADDSEVKKMMMHIERPAPLPSSLVAGLPKDVDDIVKWMLQKDPAQRPPSAIALKRRVETVIAELGGTGHFATMQVPLVNLPPGAVPPTRTLSEEEVEPKTILQKDLVGMGDGPTVRRTMPDQRRAPFNLLWLVPVVVAMVLSGMAGYRLTHARSRGEPFVAPPIPLPPDSAPTPSAADATDEPPASDSAGNDAPPAATPTPVRHRHLQSASDAQKHPKSTNGHK